MEIQLLEKQGNKYRLKINDKEVLFIPLELFTTKFLPVRKCLNNNSLGWYVNRKFVSYRKIKNVIKTKKNEQQVYYKFGY
jgi:hypothetical protein